LLEFHLLKNNTIACNGLKFSGGDKTFFLLHFLMYNAILLLCRQFLIESICYVAFLCGANPAFLSRRYEGENRMKNAIVQQLSALIDTKVPKQVLREVSRNFTRHYKAGDFKGVKKNFKLTIKLFHGKFRGYRACNTSYHDLSHTMDAFLAVSRLIHGYNLKETPLPAGTAANLLNAALLHDTGYIQEDWDVDGTGAKYTESHVERSVDFINENHEHFGIFDSDLDLIIQLIKCTGLNAVISETDFDSHGSFISGCILGTADLLGQMSDRAYLEKLLFLYREFREAGIGDYATEFDILEKTVGFYDITLKRLKGPLQSVFIHAKAHFRDRHSIDENLYMDAIDRHIEYLHRIVEDDSTNFRHKLKRGDWVDSFDDKRSH